MNTKNGFRYRVLLVMETLVVFLTTYLLIIPALTWEKSLICGLDEHIHTDSCYNGSELICHLTEHTHTDSCYDAPPAQFDPYDCGIGEHTHSPACYDGEKLVCTIPEHTHTDKCLKIRTAFKSSAPLTASSLGASPSGTAINSASDFSKLANGGSYYLNADITVSNGITIGQGKTATLDLNGHNITSSVSGSLFKLDNSSLTIKNSVSSGETVETVTSPASMWANTASFVNKKLTYYVTETEVVDPGIGRTAETLKKITVSKGIIAGSQNGRFAEIGWNGGTLTLSGGYICNFKSDNGGAVNMNGGKLVLNGAVLAGNTATLHGGAIAMQSNAEVQMSGGVISGNIGDGKSESNGDNCGGGGVFMDGNAVFRMSGGYVTNNDATCDDYWHDGGGFLLCNNVWLYISGDAVISGNRGGGGGAIKTFQNWGGSSGSVEMSGGFITANNSTAAEGGGVNINAGGYLKLTGGYFTNNFAGNGRNDSDFDDWGGGGLFCSENSATIYIESALVTNNYAGGFGGGVAGCSTGRISIFPENGLAVFDNTALGLHTSGSSSAKNEDHYLAAENPVFMANGYQDYFCALGSTITGGMLGGGISRWTGSSDGKPVRSVAADEIISGASVTGLTSESSSSDREAAKRAAKVYFCGNESPTHGGGILANGYLVFGNTTRVVNFARLTLNAKKVLFGADGAQKTVKENEFAFILIDSNGLVIDTLYNDESGKIPLDRIFTYTEPGTYTYYLKEDYSKEADHPGLQMDGKVYRISVTTKLVDVGTVPWTNFLLGQVQITNVTLYDETSGTTLYSGDPEDKEPGAVEINETMTFENREIELPANVYMSLKVEKKWENDQIPTGAEVRVQLLCDGEACGQPVTLNKSKGWTYTWTNLDESHTYTVKEVSCNIAGYYPTLTYTYSQTYTERTGSSNEAFLFKLENNYFIPASSVTVGGVYLIAYPDGGKILRTTSKHANELFDSSDCHSLSVQTGNLTIGNTSYSKWYVASQVPDDCRFTAEKHNKDGYERTVLKNQGVNSWLLSQPDDKPLKGTTGADWSSGVKVENGHIKIQKEWVKDNKWYYIVWNGSAFTIGSSIENVKIKVITGSSRNAVITNKKTANRSFTIGITKADKYDTSRILPGAVFTLTKNGQTLAFTYDAIHECYTLSTGKDAVPPMTTSMSGELCITGLGKGEYTLTETKAPAGYSLSEPLTFTLGDDTPDGAVTFIVTDSPVDSRMPDTGGRGNALIRLSGALLIVVCAASFLLCRRKKKERVK